MAVKIGLVVGIILLGIILSITLTTFVSGSEAAEYIELNEFDKMQDYKQCELFYKKAFTKDSYEKDFAEYFSPHFNGEGAYRRTKLFCGCLLTLQGFNTPTKLASLAEELNEIYTPVYPTFYLDPEELSSTLIQEEIMVLNFNELTRIIKEAVLNTDVGEI